MRHIMRGALGVALVYPLVWHYSEVAAPPAALAAAPLERWSVEPSPPPHRVAAGELAPAGAAHAVTERMPAPAMAREPVAALEPRAPEPAPVRPAEAPQHPSVQPPRDPLAELTQAPELKETLARTAEIQQHAANPAELERAIQGLDEDPAKLARLKALADMFVQLPTPRGDAYLPSSGQSATGTAAR